MNRPRACLTTGERQNQRISRVEKALLPNWTISITIENTSPVNVSIPVTMAAKASWTLVTSSWCPVQGLSRSQRGTRKPRTSAASA